MGQQFSRQNALWEQQQKMADPMYQAQLAELTAPKVNEYDSRAAAAAQYGLQPGTPEYQRFVLAGDVAAGGGEAPNSVQEYEYYKQGALDRGETPMPYEAFIIADEKATVPEGAPNIGTIPQGYEAIQDPKTLAWSMRPIPGGPEDKSVKDNLRKQNAVAATETAATAAKRALEAATNRAVDGVLGAVAAYNPESVNAEVYRQTNALKAMASIESLTAMRNASPTGAGMGNPTDRDAVLLEQKHGALDPMSPNYSRDLLDYTRALFQTIHGKEAGDALFDEQFADQIAAVVAGKPASSTAPKSNTGTTKSGLKWSIEP